MNDNYKTDNNISMPVYKHIKLVSTIPDINGMEICSIGLEMIPTKGMRDAAIKYLYEKYVVHYEENPAPQDNQG